MTAEILAHQGGWDELGLVAVPVVVIALLLVIADKRARRALDKQSGPGSADPGTAEEPPDAQAPQGPAV